MSSVNDTPANDEMDLEVEISISEPLCAVFRRRLREDGQKYTPERAQILDTIIQIDDVFEADTLQQELRGSEFRVSKATIYRTLKLLQDTGIIQQVPIESEQAKFILAYGKRPHDLLIRVDTQHVESIDAPELQGIAERVCNERGLSLKGWRLQVFASGDD